MKYFLSLFILFFIASSASSQDKSRKDGFISISLGVAAPFGDFAETDPNNNESGFAESGISINLINFGYLFSENIGITAMIQGAGFPVESRNGGSSSIWSYGTFMVGPLFTARYPKSDAEFDFRLMLGTMSGLLTTSGGTSAEGEGGAVGLGAGVRYNISDLIALSSNLDFITGRPEFDTNGNSFTQSMSSANLTFGITFRID